MGVSMYGGTQDDADDDDGDLFGAAPPKAPAAGGGGGLFDMDVSFAMGPTLPAFPHLQLDSTTCAIVHKTSPFHPLCRTRRIKTRQRRRRHPQHSLLARTS